MSSYVQFDGSDLSNNFIHAENPNPEIQKEPSGSIFPWRTIWIFYDFDQKGVYDWCWYRFKCRWCVRVGQKMPLVMGWWGVLGVWEFQ